MNILFDMRRGSSLDDFPAAVDDDFCNIVLRRDIRPDPYPVGNDITVEFCPVRRACDSDRYGLIVFNR
jgi:hypothetical protein